jgi:serine/threonine protein kinase/tetratricopeptide (TPR) repeat protein
MNERDLFIAARRIQNTAERSAYLDGACSDNAPLREQVEALLEEQEHLGSFLERPAARLSDIAQEPTLLEGPGGMIGSYKLMEQIGEGGFGIVFMAEQEQPVRRKVALKILKPGMDTRRVIARFEAERQALALMDHLNIARVLDGGETATGRPYFVMDLVKGIPITKYCDQAQLTTQERLELFVSVCQAVQHAHQKGIIHRDLKPSNVLVTHQDGAPLVKIIDFGIAKAVGHHLTDKTLSTSFAQMIGTPPYMSPEQMALSNVDVDTRSDIYSLGALLYELLAGTTPFDKGRLKEANYDEMRRIIREEEPPKPSTQISTLGEAIATVAMNRKSDPKRLGQLIRGELDWVVMKALEKDRNRRYETASAFAADVERYLHDEPVAACPPSTLYRVGKFVRRRKAALVTTAAISVTLVAAVVGLLIANYQIATQRNLAEREHEQSEANFHKARLAVNDYFTLVSESELLDVPGLDDLRKQLLEAALNYYEDFIREHGAASQRRADVAAAHLRVAEITYLNGGSSDQYFPHLRDGVDLIERLIQEHRDTPEVQRQLAGLYVTGKELDISARGSIELQEVARYLEKLAHILEKFVADNPNVPELQNDLAGACRFVAQSYSLGDEALPWFEKATRLWESLARAHPGVAAYRQNLARVYELYGIHLNMKGRRDDAYQSIEKAFFLRRDLARHEPGRASYTAWLAVSYRELGELDSALKHSQEAEKSIRQAQELQQKLVADFPTLHTYRHDLAQTQLSLARVIKTSGRVAEALPAYRQALGARQELVARFPRIPVYRDEYVQTVAEVASFLAIVGKRQDAANMVREAAQFCCGKMETHSLSIEERSAYVEISGKLAAGLRRLGRAEEAEKLRVQTAAVSEQLLKGFTTNVTLREAELRAYINLLRLTGEDSATLGKWGQALAAYARLVEVDPGDHWHWYVSATLYLYLGDIESYRRICDGMLERFGERRIPAVAERTAKTCALAFESGIDPERVLQVTHQAIGGTEKHQDYRWFVLAQAMAEYRAGHRTAAVDWLERFAPQTGGAHSDATAFAVLAMAQHHLGRSEAARAALSNAQAILRTKMPDPQRERPFGNDWHDWLRAQILCREAEALLKSSASPETPN